MMLRDDILRRGFRPRGPMATSSDTASKPAAVVLRVEMLATLLAPEFEIGPWDDDDRDGEQHHRRCGKTLAEVLRLEHVVVDVFGGDFRGIAGPAARLRHHQVVDLDDARRDDDERSEEHTSELQSLMRISYAVFCLTKKQSIQHQQTCILSIPHKKTPH